LPRLFGVHATATCSIDVYSVHGRSRRTGAHGPDPQPAGEGRGATRAAADVSGEAVLDVGVVGIGRMGRGIAGRVLGGGHDVVVYNRTRGRTNELEREGARVAASA